MKIWKFSERTPPNLDTQLFYMGQPFSFYVNLTCYHECTNRANPKFNVNSLERI